MIRKTKSLLPVYLGPCGLERLFYLLSKATPDSITPIFLQAQGFGVSDSYSAINGLRFLEILKRSGSRPSRFIKAFNLTGTSRQKAFARLVRRVYSPVFRRVDRPQYLHNETLRNEFILIYDLSPRIARGAILAFKWLCQEAGLLSPGWVKVRHRGTGKRRENGLPVAHIMIPLTRRVNLVYMPDTLAERNAVFKNYRSGAFREIAQRIDAEWPERPQET